MLGLEVVLGGRSGYGFSLEGLDHLGADADPPIGIGFGEGFFTLPVIVLVKRVDHAEVGVVFNRPGKDFGDDSSLLVTDARTVNAGGRDRDHQGITPLAQ